MATALVRVVKRKRPTSDLAVFFIVGLLLPVYMFIPKKKRSGDPVMLRPMINAFTDAPCVLPLGGWCFAVRYTVKPIWILTPHLRIFGWSLGFHFWYQ